MQEQHQQRAALFVWVSGELSSPLGDTVGEGLGRKAKIPKIPP